MKAGRSPPGGTAVSCARYRMAKSISEKIIKNTVFNAAGRFWGVLVGILLTPYIIGHIGLERYGILTLVGAATGYFGLLDFGIGGSLVKYIAEFYATRDFKRINQVIMTGFLFYSALAAFLTLLSFFAARPLTLLLKTQPQLFSETVFAFFLGIITFSLSNALSPFAAVQSGLQRMDIANKVGIAMSVPNVLGTMFCLGNGYGFIGLMFVNMGIVLVNGACNLAIAYRLLPGLSLGAGEFSGEMFRKLFKLGYKLQITTIANLFHFQVDKILLAYLLNVEFVGYYNVASQLASKVRELPLLLISAIFPAASELGAKTDKEGLEKLYFRSLKYVVLAGLPVSAAAIFFARAFITLWLGQGYGKAVFTLQMLMVAYFVNILSGPGFTILNGLGLPRYGMLSSGLAAALNLGLSAPLALMIGYNGVVFGTVASMIVGAGYFIIKFHKVMAIPMLGAARPVFFRPLVACAAAVGAVYLLEPGGGLFKWHLLAGFGCIYAAVFFAVIMSLGHFDDFDKQVFKNCLIKARRRLGLGDRESSL